MDNQVTSKALKDVLTERRRRIEEKGWTPEHDDQHHTGEIALAGAGYAHAAAWAVMAPSDKQFTDDDRPTPWPDEWEFKPGMPRRMLVKATALMLAEIERIDRAEQLAVAQAESAA